MMSQNYIDRSIWAYIKSQVKLAFGISNNTKFFIDVVE